MQREEQLAAAVRWRGLLYRVALNRCGSPADAEDAVQETLLKLSKTSRSFSDEEHLRAWLIRVTVSHCRDRLRAPWRKRRVPTDKVPDAPVFDDHTQQELYDAVMTLPP